MAISDIRFKEIFEAHLDGDLEYERSSLERRTRQSVGFAKVLEDDAHHAQREEELVCFHLICIVDPADWRDG